MTDIRVSNVSLDSPLSNSLLFKDVIDVTPPEHVSWLPQTLGWKIVAVVILVYLSKRVYQYCLNRWHNRYRQEAIDTLKTIDTTHVREAAKDLNKVLKTVATYKDSAFSSLTGGAFLARLDLYYSEQEILFNDELGARWQKEMLSSPDNATLTSDEISILIDRACIWSLLHCDVISVNQEGSAHV